MRQIPWQPPFCDSAPGRGDLAENVSDFRYGFKSAARMMEPLNTHPISYEGKYGYVVISPSLAESCTLS